MHNQKLNRESELTLSEVKEKAIGYFASAFCEENYSFGSEANKKLFPWSYVSRVMPVNRFQGWLNDIYPYWEKRLDSINERQQRKSSEWFKENESNLIIYHTPLNLNDIIKNFRRDLDSKREFPKSDIEWIPEYSLEGKYLEAIKRFSAEPYLIHNMTYVSPLNFSRGYHTEFYVVGDKKVTSRLSKLILDHPRSIRKIISDLTGFEDRHFGRSYSCHRTLIHFDTTRKPKKVLRKIK